MAGPSADRITEWEGGSLSELVAMLQAAALPVRIEVIAPGTTGSNAGEVHLLAGGLADAFAGSLRRDDAMAALQRLEGARYVIESRLPHPESGSLSEPGPHQGSLKDRPLASLMRYCEDYVLTCRLEVWRGQDRAVISYRRGEIIGTVVGGSEGSELLPEVLSWTEGAYEIILPAPLLPQMPSRGRDGSKPERKRHSTLPMMTAQEAKPEGLGASRTDTGAKIPSAGNAAVPAAPQPAQPSVFRQPAQPQAAPGQQVARPPGLAAQKAAPQQSVPTSATQKPIATTPRPIATAPRPVAVAIPGLLQPEMTTRGTPPVPAVPLVPAPGPQTAPRPTMQGAAVPLVPPKPAAPVPQPKPATPTAQPAPLAKPAAPTAQPQPKPAAPVAQPAPQARQKPDPFAIQPAPQPKPVAPTARPALEAQPKPAAPAAQPASQAQPRPNPFAIQPAPQPKPVAPAAQPVSQAQPKLAAPTAQPAVQAQPKPIPLVLQPAPQAQPKPNPPAQAAAASPAAPPAAQPPIQLANQVEKPQPAPARPTKPSAAVSNDLMPASGTFEAKPKHASYLPPTTAPIQIADEPQVVASEQPSTPVVVPSRPPAPKRQRASSGKGIAEHPVRVYVLIGLAIGMGIVLAYWAYWYLPFGHH
jgi:hypothetical protein